MIGGVVERNQLTSYWVYLTDSENENTNIYRELECLFLNEFAMNSRFINSNLALEHDLELIMQNFEQFCQTDDIEKIELWKVTVEEIISIRELVGRETRMKSTKKTRDGHEFRLTLWRSVLSRMSLLVEAARTRLKEKMVENDKVIAEQLEREQLIQALKQDTPLSDTEQGRRKDEMEEAMRRKQQDDDERKLLFLAMKLSKEEVKTQEKSKSEERLKMASDRIIQAEQVKMRQSEKVKIKKEDEFLDKEKEKVAKERDELEQIQTRQVGETRERETAAKMVIQSNPSVSVMLSNMETLKRSFPTQRKQYNEKKAQFEKKDAERSKRLDELNEGTLAHIQATKEYNSLDKEHAILMNLGSFFKKDDDEIKELEVKIKKTKEAEAEIELCKKELPLLVKPGNIKCSNPLCQITPVKPCTGCRIAYYCSKECQKADWSKHKDFCRKSRGGYRKTKRKSRKSRKRITYKNVIL